MQLSRVSLYTSLGLSFYALLFFLRPMLCILGAQVTLFTVFWSHITMPADETWQTQKRWHADLQSLPPSPSSSDNLHRPMWGKNKRHKGYESLYTRVGAFHRTPFYYFPPHHLKKLLGSILYTLLHIGPSSSHSRQFLFFSVFFSFEILVLCSSCCL